MEIDPDGTGFFQILHFIDHWLPFVGHCHMLEFVYESLEQLDYIILHSFTCFVGCDLYKIESQADVARQESSAELV